MWVLSALLLACGTPEVPPAASSPDVPPLEDVTLTVGAGDEALTVSLAGAWIDGDGQGRGVQAEASVPSAPPLAITGHRTSWSLREGTVVFEGEVRATRGDLELTCDRLEVIYDGDRVARATATGSVRVSQGDRRARGDTAVLTTSDGRLALEGDPRVEDGPNRLAGDRIVLFLDDERLECERCRLDVDGEALR